jgi:hypothetical protein
LEVAEAIGPDFPNAAPALLEHFRIGEDSRDRGVGLIEACFGRRRAQTVNGNEARGEGGWFVVAPPADSQGGTTRQSRIH